MALAQSRGGDAHELRGGAQRFDVRRAAVTHTGAEAADHLVHRFGHRPAVWHAPLNALGNELGVFLLEVAVLRPLRHRSERTHAAVDLELAALEHLGLARGFLAPGKHRAEHHDAAARGERLDDIAGVLDAAVGDDGNAVFVGDLRAFHHGGDLRHADARDDARRADGAGADADLNAVGPRLNERLRGGGGGDVAGDELRVGVFGLDVLHRFHDVAGVAVGTVEHESVHARVKQRAGAVKHVRRNADGGGDKETAAAVLRGVRIGDRLFDVLDRDEALETEVLIHDGQLFDLVAAERFLRFFQRGPLAADNEIFARHKLANLAVHVGLKLHIAVGDDADELAGLVHDGNAGNAELGAELVRVAQRVLRGKEKRVGDDAVLAALDEIDLFRLLLDRHVFMDDADAALARDGDRHA